MRKTCVWLGCSSASGRPDCQHVTFVPFPNAKSIKKCLRWLALSGRPDEELNVLTVHKSTYVCSKHFPDGQPTKLHPDPVAADKAQHIGAEDADNTYRIEAQVILERCDNLLSESERLALEQSCPVHKVKEEPEELRVWGTQADLQDSTVRDSKNPHGKKFAYKTKPPYKSQRRVQTRVQTRAVGATRQTVHEGKLRGKRRACGPEQRNSSKRNKIGSKPPEKRVRSCTPGHGDNRSGSTDTHFPCQLETDRGDRRSGRRKNIVTYKMTPECGQKKCGTDQSAGLWPEASPLHEGENCGTGPSDQYGVVKNSDPLDDIRGLCSCQRPVSIVCSTLPPLGSSAAQGTCSICHGSRNQDNPRGQSDKLSCGRDLLVRMFHIGLSDGELPICNQCRCKLQQYNHLETNIDQLMESFAQTSCTPPSKKCAETPLLPHLNGHSRHVMAVLEQFRYQGILCDIDIRSKCGFIFKAHKMVLMTCSAFLYARCMAGETIFLTQAKSSSVACLLHYMYHGILLLKTANLPDVLQLADEWGMPIIVRACLTRIQAGGQTLTVAQEDIKRCWVDKGSNAASCYISSGDADDVPSKYFLSCNIAAISSHQETTMTLCAGDGKQNPSTSSSAVKIASVQSASLVCDGRGSVDRTVPGEVSSKYVRSSFDKNNNQKCNRRGETCLQTQNTEQPQLETHSQESRTHSAGEIMQTEPENRQDISRIISDRCPGFLKAMAQQYLKDDRPECPEVNVEQKSNMGQCSEDYTVGSKSKKSTSHSEILNKYSVPIVTSESLRSHPLPNPRNTILRSNPVLCTLLNKNPVLHNIQQPSQKEKDLPHVPVSMFVTHAMNSANVSSIPQKGFNISDKLPYSETNSARQKQVSSPSLPTAMFQGSSTPVLDPCAMPSVNHYVTTTCTMAAETVRDAVRNTTATGIVRNDTIRNTTATGIVRNDTVQNTTAAGNVRNDTVQNTTATGVVINGVLNAMAAKTVQTNLISRPGEIGDLGSPVQQAVGNKDLNAPARGAKGGGPQNTQPAGPVGGGNQETQNSGPGGGKIRKKRTTRAGKGGGPQKTQPAGPVGGDNQETQNSVPGGGKIRKKRTIRPVGCYVNIKKKQATGPVEGDIWKIQTTGPAGGDIQKTQSTGPAGGGIHKTQTTRPAGGDIQKTQATGPVGHDIQKTYTTGPVGGDFQVMLISESVGNSAQLTQSAVPQLTQSAVPQLTQAAVPQLTQSAVTQLTQSAVPQLTQSAVPQLTQSAVPQLTQSAVPQLTQSAVPQLTQSAVPQLTPSAVPFGINKCASAPLADIEADKKFCSGNMVQFGTFPHPVSPSLQPISGGLSVNTASMYPVPGGVIPNGIVILPNTNQATSLVPTTPGSFLLPKSVLSAPAASLAHDAPGNFPPFFATVNGQAGLVALSIPNMPPLIGSPPAAANLNPHVQYVDNPNPGPSLSQEILPGFTSNVSMLSVALPGTPAPQPFVPCASQSDYFNAYSTAPPTTVAAAAVVRTSVVGSFVTSGRRMAAHQVTKSTLCNPTSPTPILIIPENAQDAGNSDTNVGAVPSMTNRISETNVPQHLFRDVTSHYTSAQGQDSEALP